MRRRLELSHCDLLTSQAGRLEPERPDRVQVDPSQTARLMDVLATTLSSRTKYPGRPAAARHASSSSHSLVSTSTPPARVVLSPMGHTSARSSPILCRPCHDGVTEYTKGNEKRRAIPNASGKKTGERARKP